jgi:hypothetical protein
MLQGDALHTYITHPKRLLVHFCSIKFLSYILALHHARIAEDLSVFFSFAIETSIFAFPAHPPGTALSCTIQYD